MFRSARSWSSFFGLVVAAGASLATSAPPPDWTARDRETGEITLMPDQEEVVLRFDATTRAASAVFAFDVRVEDKPRGGAEHTTPILFFVGRPTPAGEPFEADGADGGADGGAGSVPVPMYAIPSASPTDELGYEHGLRGSVPEGVERRPYEVRIAWESPNSHDGKMSVTTTSGGATSSVDRPRAPREPLRILWRAELRAEGFGDEPEGLLLDLEPR